MATVTIRKPTVSAAHLARIKARKPARIATDDPDNPELGGADAGIRSARLARLRDGKPRGEDIRRFREMLRLTQERFAAALGINVTTLRGWEQDQRHPQGPAIALPRMVATHPRLVLEAAQRGRAAS